LKIFFATLEKKAKGLTGEAFQELLKKYGKPTK
jgi:hypothetical protein